MAGRLVGAAGNPFASPAQAAWNPERWAAQQGAAGGVSPAMNPKSHMAAVAALLIVLVVVVAYHRHAGPFKKRG